jgi:ankyrin repeat protein
MIKGGLLTRTVVIHSRTPLYEAALKGHETIVRLLVDCGEDIDAKNHHNEAALPYTEQLY